MRASRGAGGDGLNQMDSEPQAHRAARPDVTPSQIPSQLEVWRMTSQVQPKVCAEAHEDADPIQPEAHEVADQV